MIRVIFTFVAAFLFIFLTISGIEFIKTIDAPLALNVTLRTACMVVFIVGGFLSIIAINGDDYAFFHPLIGETGFRIETVTYADGTKKYLPYRQSRLLAFVWIHMSYKGPEREIHPLDTMAQAQGVIDRYIGGKVVGREYKMTKKNA